MRKILLTVAVTLSLSSAARADTQPYYGEIATFAFNFCPTGWLPADGRLVSTATYDTLFLLIGTTYGGDGVNNFALPATKPAKTKLKGANLTQCIAVQGIFPARP